MSSVVVTNWNNSALQFSAESKHWTCLQMECSRQMLKEKLKAALLEPASKQETLNMLHNRVLTEADCTAAVLGKVCSCRLRKITVTAPQLLLAFGEVPPEQYQEHSQGQHCLPLVQVQKRGRCAEHWAERALVGATHMTDAQCIQIVHFKH